MRVSLLWTGAHAEQGRCPTTETHVGRCAAPPLDPPSRLGLLFCPADHRPQAITRFLAYRGQIAEHALKNADVQIMRLPKLGARSIGMQLIGARGRPSS